jgi:hypothetical protein
MTYPVTTTKTDETLVLELFNYENGTSYEAKDFIIHRNPVAQLPGGRNTKLIIEVIDSKYDVPTLEIAYDRIPLAELYKNIVIEVHEVDVFNDDKTGYLDSLIIAEICRLYQVTLHKDNFFIEWESLTKAVFVCARNNIAFIGRVPIILTESLHTRIPKVILNGFSSSAVELLPPPYVPELIDGYRLIGDMGEDLYKTQLSIATKGHVYFLPGSGARSKVGMLNTTTEETTYLVGEAKGRWLQPVVALNGNIYAVDRNEDNLLCIDTTTNTSSVYSFGTAGSGYKWSGIVVGANGMLYLPHAKNTRGVKINPETLEVTNLTHSAHVRVAYRTMGRDAIGNVYFFPYNESRIIVVNTANDSVSYIGPTYPTMAGLYAHSYITKGGFSIAIPLKPNTPIVMITDKGVYKAIAPTVGVYAAGSVFEAPNGKVYICGSATHTLGEINLVEGTITALTLTGEANACSGNILVSEDNIAYLPPAAYSQKTTTLNLDTLVLELMGAPLQKYHWGSPSMAENGEIYYPPMNSRSAMTIR